jgi:hypothetical protein
MMSGKSLVAAAFLLFLCLEPEFAATSNVVIEGPLARARDTFPGLKTDVSEGQLLSNTVEAIGNVLKTKLEQGAVASLVPKSVSVMQGLSDTMQGGFLGGAVPAKRHGEPIEDKKSDGSAAAKSNSPLVHTTLVALDPIVLPDFPALTYDVANKVFVVASATLLFAFSLLQAPALLHSKYKTAFAGFITVIFLISASSWLFGFGIVAHLQLQDPTTKVDVLIPTFLRLLASVFFTFGPTTSLLTVNFLNGIPWSDYVGTVIFHAANTIGLGASLLSLAPKQKPDQLTVATMFFTVATALLLSAGHNVFDVNGNSKKYPKLTGGLQIAGAALLLIGSVIMLVPWPVAVVDKPTTP